MSNNLHFVPLWDKVIRRYARFEDLPSHGAMDDRLYSGKIQVTLTAMSPLLVGGEGRPVINGRPTVTFSRDARNQFRIPGSTLRGLIRQNMQILGLGAVRVGGNEDIPGCRKDKDQGNGKGRRYDRDRGYGRDRKNGKEQEFDKNWVYGNRDPADGLPPAHRQVVMDYPRSIMGCVFQEPDEIKTDKDGNPRMNTRCYRSRISVGDLNPVKKPLELNAQNIEQRLPRQGDPDFVVEEDNGFRLSGVRQYPPRDLAPEPRSSRQRIQPLDAGAKFTGVIRYRNLHADELGLLLWCLRLEEGCLHTIGMGKAKGYGLVRLKITRLVEYDNRVLYGSLTGTGTQAVNVEARVEELIRSYRNYAAQSHVAGQDPAQMAHIRTFLALRRKK